MNCSQLPLWDTEYFSVLPVGLKVVLYRQWSWDGRVAVV